MASEDVFSAEERITFTTGDVSSPPDLRLLHFNDGEFPIPARTRHQDLDSSLDIDLYDSLSY
jgi:hypothetical protein